MDRAIRTQMWAAALLTTLVLSAVACGPRPEQPLLEDFFAKSQAGDKAGLQRFATVIFEPGRDGVMSSFSIRSVTSSRRPMVAGGELLVKDVVIDARVRLPGGSNARKNMVVKLQQALPRGAQERADQWVVTDVTDAASPP